ncbi:MAG: hypothetical protein Q6373_017810 [Candidatus Sigynarchaeota archaeon]
MEDKTMEAAMLAWEDINDIIEDLQEAIAEIEKSPSLKSFKAAIVRAIASMRAERASIEAKLPSMARTRRLEYMTSIANERLRDEIKAIL